MIDENERLRGTLAAIENGTTARITHVVGHGAFRKRITEMGFVKGKLVTAIKNAPLQDPIEYEVMGYRVSLRRNEARLIRVIIPDNDDTLSAEDLAPVSAVALGLALRKVGDR